jgi:hypothetical protein
MPDRDTPRSRDTDDWFADLEPAAPPRERLVERPATPPAGISAPGADGDDDWLADDRHTDQPRHSAFAALLPERWVAIAAGVLFVAVLLVGGLVLAGVFAASQHKHVATTTRAVSTQTTTASTTTQTPVATVPPPGTTLKPSDQGTQVRALQKALARLGYFSGTFDGIYGPATTRAVARFQNAAKLTADGIFGPATLAALVSALTGP